MKFLVEGDMRLRGLSKIFVSDDLNLEITVEPCYFKVPREMKKKFEIAGLRNNRGSVKGKGKSKGIRSSFEIAGTSN